jgi:hypothetical protein
MVHLQRKNESEAVNPASTHVAKTLNFFFNHEKLLNALKKSRKDVASTSHLTEKRDDKRQLKSAKAHAKPAMTGRPAKIKFRNGRKTSGKNR